MKISATNRIRTLGVFVAAALALVPATRAHAQAQPGKSAVTMTFRNLTLAHDSSRAKARGTADAAMNDTLRYELVFTNAESRAVTGVTFDNAVPANLSLVGGSVAASMPARMEYSIDGGRTFSTQPMVTTNINGRDVQRPAAPEKYTHIRWTVTGSLAPGAKVTARYDARVGKAAR